MRKRPTSCPPYQQKDYAVLGISEHSYVGLVPVWLVEVDTRLAVLSKLMRSRRLERITCFGSHALDASLSGIE